ncbi:MAG: type II toxin-antitoxin system death-on-curing family toxin [Chlamydiae bacterium]|nr:MAG: type II toxin-antitoxin system death-on-curing family toxin [Chlamydiota bacterium]
MIFITVQEVINEHAKLIHTYGGLSGIRDMGLLASAVDMPRMAVFKKYLHPTVFDKAAAYLFHIICNHPFIDGNKRTGTAIALAFLKINGIRIKIAEKQKILALEELVVYTAESKATKKQIANFFKECSPKKNWI